MSTLPDEVTSALAAMTARLEAIENRATTDQRSQLVARSGGTDDRPSWALGAGWMAEVERQLAHLNEQLLRLTGALTDISGRITDRLEEIKNTQREILRKLDERSN